MWLPDTNVWIAYFRKAPSSVKTRIAIALAYDLTVVTHNTREFSRVPGLKLEDWEVQ